jgi:simple sugar transport system permease protein
MVDTGRGSTGVDRYAGASVLDRFRAHPAGNVIIVFLVFLAVCVIISLLYPSDFRFTQPANIRILMRAIPPLGIMALGVGLLMICGEFDLSVGAVFIVAPYIMVFAYVNDVPLALAILAGMASGMTIGLINGVITTRFGIPSFITTLGMLFMLRAFARIIANNRPLSFFPPDGFEDALTGRLGTHMQAQFLWFLGIAGVCYLFLNRHRLGNHFLSVGGNREAAIAVGVNANHVKRIGFVICSVGAAIAGTISATRVNAIIPAQTLTGLELQAIAACVVGGVFLFGGRGTVLGICLGVALILTVDNLLILLRAPGVYLQGFVGAIVIIAVIVNAWFARRVGGQQD